MDQLKMRTAPNPKTEGRIFWLPGPPGPDLPNPALPNLARTA